MSFLKGFTVLDLASVGPAARASRILADYGMNVIKISPVAAKGKKQIEPDFHTYGAGRGTQKIRLDLKTDEGKEVLYRLAEKADVFIESFRPGVAQRIGVGYEQLKEKNPKIVYCSTSGYGQDGPYSQWAGHDINYLALSGFLSCSGTDADGCPAMPGATIADSAGGGMHAALSILSGLLSRSGTGEGCYLDVAATEGVISLMSMFIDQYLATGEEVTTRSSLLNGLYAWYSVYKTGDGKAISVGAVEPHFFKSLCSLLGLEEFADAQYNLDKQDAMRAAFKDKFLTKSRDEWVEILAANNTCTAPVLSISEVVKDPQVNARNIFMTANHPVQGEFQQIGPIFAGGERIQPVHQTRAPGETNAKAVLASAGFSEQETEHLLTTGFVE